MTRPWSAEDDERLVAWGCAVGYGYVAEHDLGRTWEEGVERIAYLREHWPAIVKRIEREVRSDV